MSVTVFTNKGCHNCEALKAHLHNVGVEFKEMNAAECLDPKQKDYFERHPDWRTSGVVDAVALLNFENALPVAVIDGTAYTYKETLRMFPAKQHTDITQAIIDTGIAASIAASAAVACV